MGNAPADDNITQQFLRLVDQVETARDADMHKERQMKLDAFVVACTEKKRQTLRQYFENLIVHDETVLAVQRQYRSRYRRLFNSIGETVGAVSGPVARLSEETMRLIVTTLGLTAYGFYRGAQTTFRAFRTAA